MFTVSELKNACERIEMEFGSDSKVCIYIRDENGGLINGDYCLDVFCGKDGTLYLTNQPFKKGKDDEEQ